MMLLVISFSLSAQEMNTKQAPDYKKIKKEITDKSSKFYYSKILKRFTENDTSLRAKDYHYIYYGYFFNDNYNAMGNLSAYTDSLNVLTNKKVWLIDDKRNYLKYNLELLRSNPLELDILMHVFMAYKELKMDDEAELFRIKIKAILETILATGDGQSCATGYHVLKVSDEYNILSYLGFKYGGSQSLTPDQCDYLKLRENEEHMEGLYFDVKEIFKNYYKMFEESEKKSNKK